MATLLLALTAALVTSPLGGQAAKPLAGGVGVVGTPYRFGKDRSALQFTLTGVSFATRFFADNTAKAAPKGKKYLLLNYTVQNASSTNELTYSWSNLLFTVVTANGENCEGSQVVVNPDKRTTLYVSLKPAQKTSALTYIEVPAEDPIPKLIVKHSETSNVLRFDLKGKVKKFLGPFGGPDGVKAVDTADAKMGVPLEFGTVDVTLDKVEETQAIGDRSAGDGKKFYLLYFTAANPSYLEQLVTWSTFEGEMQDENGESIPYKQSAITPSTATEIYKMVEPGGSVKGRLVFEALAGIKPTKLILECTANKRKYNIPLQ